MLSKVVPQRGHKPIQSLINVQTRPAFPFPSPRSRSSLSPSASNVGSTLNSVVMMEMCAARPASGLLSVIRAARIVRLTKHTMAYRELPHPRRFRRPGPRRWASTCPGLRRAGSHAHTHLREGTGCSSAVQTQLAEMPSSQRLLCFRRHGQNHKHSSEPRLQGGTVQVAPAVPSSRRPCMRRSRKEAATTAIAKAAPVTRSSRVRGSNYKHTNNPDAAS